MAEQAVLSTTFLEIPKTGFLGTITKLLKDALDALVGWHGDVVFQYRNNAKNKLHTPTYLLFYS